MLLWLKRPDDLARSPIPGRLKTPSRQPEILWVFIIERNTHYFMDIATTVLNAKG
jgi:hypothetical protein